MKTIVDKYMDIDIEYDSDNETFAIYSNHYDKEFSANSLSALKVKVDKFLKEKAVFKEFLAVRVFYNEIKEVNKFISFRKDNRFVYINENNKPEQVSEYDEQYHYIIDSLGGVEPIKNKLKDIDNKISDLQKEKKDLVGSFITPLKSLTDYKKENLAELQNRIL